MDLNLLREHLLEGQVIPACPLPLDEEGKWSQCHQRALVRYYREAGSGGLAVGVHSTQFEIREPKHALFEPVLALVNEVLDTYVDGHYVRIAGICGDTKAALREVEIASQMGYHAGLLSLKGVASQTEEAILQHCREVAEVLPIIGFYLQSAVGGRPFSYRFWHQFSEIENVVAIKIAPFNRYQTLDVIRAVADAGREDVALYTGNDDNIVADLLTPFPTASGGERFIVGGLLGQWGVWTRTAVAMMEEIKVLRRDGTSISREWLLRNAEITDANSAIFDAANHFAGCIPGIMEVLRRQGLSPSARCLNPQEALSSGQMEELDRVIERYPHLTDGDFIEKNLERWLKD